MPDPSRAIADVRYEGIAELGIAPDGRLYLRPEAREFSQVYRAASGVEWDDLSRALAVAPGDHQKPEDHFARIWGAVASEYGVALVVNEGTLWTRLDGGEKAAIGARLLALSEEHTNSMHNADASGGANARRLALESRVSAVRPKAHAAFQAGQYPEAADLFLQIRDALTPSERQKLLISMRRR